MPSLLQQLQNIDISSLKLSDGRTLGQAMIDEGNRLRDLLQYHLIHDALLTSPRMYAFGKKKRTGLLEQSIKVDSKLRYNKATGKITVVVWFDDSMSGASGYGVWSNQKGDLGDYNLALILNNGYRVRKDVWFKDLINFGIRQPSYFIQNAIDDFNAQNSLGIYIDYNTDVILV